MHKGRLEAFSDGVIAILITIMVLELKPPQGFGWDALAPMAPTFAAYVLSFINVGIYWNNHHHMFQAAEVVNGSVLWANLHLLFWLSLFSWATGWLGQAGIHTVPVAVYGFILFMAGVAYTILLVTLVKANGKDSELARAVGRDYKGKLSLVFYAVAIGLAWVSPIASCVLFVCVAIMWFVPDTRIEHLYAGDRG